MISNQAKRSDRTIRGGLSVATEAVTTITVVVYIECQSKVGHCNGYGISLKDNTVH